MFPKVYFLKHPAHATASSRIDRSRDVIADDLRWDSFCAQLSSQCQNRFTIKGFSKKQTRSLHRSRSLEKGRYLVIRIQKNVGRQLVENNLPTKKFLSLVIQETLKLFSIDVFVTSRVWDHKNHANFILSKIRIKKQFSWFSRTFTKEVPSTQINATQI